MKFDRWPLGINSAWDAVAVEQGLGHWSCVHPREGCWWVRKDGLTHERRWGEDTIEVLREIDDRFRMQEEQEDCGGCS